MREVGTTLADRASTVPEYLLCVLVAECAGVTRSFVRVKPVVTVVFT
jgi:hypothetical protein